MVSCEIQRKIKEKENKIRSLISEVEIMKKELHDIEKRERKDKEKEFFTNLGIKEYKDGMFIIFNKKGEFIKVINYKDNYKYIDEFAEKELKPNKLYAHNLSSFRNRNIDWYDMNLKEQLINLCWEFTNTCSLKNTTW